MKNERRARRTKKNGMTKRKNGNNNRKNRRNGINRRSPRGAYPKLLLLRPWSHSSPPPFSTTQVSIFCANIYRCG